MLRKEAVKDVWKIMPDKIGLEQQESNQEADKGWRIGNDSLVNILAGGLRKLDKWRVDMRFIESG